MTRIQEAYIHRKQEIMREREKKIYDCVRCEVFSCMVIVEKHKEDCPYDYLQSVYAHV